MAGNPNPKHKYKSPYPAPVAERSICVRLSPELDEYVRSLPNRTEWLRQVIAEAVERDKAENSN